MTRAEAIEGMQSLLFAIPSNHGGTNQLSLARHHLPRDAPLIQSILSSFWGRIELLRSLYFLYHIVRNKNMLIILLTPACRREEQLCIGYVPAAGSCATGVCGNPGYVRRVKRGRTWPSFKHRLQPALGFRCCLNLEGVKPTYHGTFSIVHRG